MGAHPIIRALSSQKPQKITTGAELNHKAEGSASRDAAQHIHDVIVVVQSLHESDFFDKVILRCCACMFWENLYGYITIFELLSCCLFIQRNCWGISN